MLEFRYHIVRTERSRPADTIEKIVAAACDDEIVARRVWAALEDRYPEARFEVVDTLPKPRAG